MYLIQYFLLITSMEYHRVKNLDQNRQMCQAENL